MKCSAISLYVSLFLVFVIIISNKNIKGKLSDSFTNYNDVGNTKVSVSIKKT